MTKQEFIDAAIIAQISGGADIGVVGHESLFIDAEALATEREKRYGAFDDVDIDLRVKEQDTFDPYDVNWGDAPEWATGHVVSKNSVGYWIGGELYIWTPCGDGNWKGNPEWKSNLLWEGTNPNWTQSLRSRPKKIEG